MTEQEKQQLNTLIDTFLNKLRLKQDDFLQQTGRYFQGIKIPSQIPELGTPLSFDGKVKPSYQTKNWDDMTLNLGIKLPFQIEIHQHYRPKTGGTGYVIYFKVKKNNVIYHKTVAIGNNLDLSMFAHDWTELKQ